MIKAINVCIALKHSCKEVVWQEAWQSKVLDLFALAVLIMLPKLLLRWTSVWLYTSVLDSFKLVLADKFQTTPTHFASGEKENNTVNLANKAISTVNLAKICF